MDVDEFGLVVGELGSEDEVKEEVEFLKYDNFLGSLLDEEDEEEVEDEDLEEVFFCKLWS